MSDGFCFVDLVPGQELHCILLLDLVLPGIVLTICPCSSELLVSESCARAAAMVLLLLLLVLFPDIWDVVVGRVAVRDLDTTKSLRMRLSILQQVACWDRVDGRRIAVLLHVRANVVACSSSRRGRTR